MKLVKQIALVWLGIFGAIVFYSFVFWLISFLPNLIGFLSFVGVVMGSIFTLIALMVHFGILDD